MMNNNTKHEWKAPAPTANNVIIELDKPNYLSYNKHPCAGMAFLESDESNSETALYGNGKWFILNGDFREEYNEAIDKYGKDAEALYYAVFCKHKKDSTSTWSTGDSWDGDSGVNIEKWLEQRLANM